MAKFLFYKAASKKFEERFRNNINEPIEIEFHQAVFRVFLQLLYGQSFEDATMPLCEANDLFKTEHEFKTYYLSFLIDLLKLTVSYDVKPLRNEVEDIIIDGEYVNIRDLCKILDCLKDFDVEERLRGFYEEFIKSNKTPINQQLRKNALNEREKSEMLQMSQKLKPFL
jgi:hypothetical protein